MAIELENWLCDIATAREALRRGQPRQAVRTVAPVLEAILRELLLKGMETTGFAPGVRKAIKDQVRRFPNQRETFDATIRRATVRELSDLFNRNFYKALESVTHRSTLPLESFNILRLASIRSGPVHGTVGATDLEGRLLVYAAEVFLEYLVPLPEGDVPLRFSGPEECLKLLLRRIWLFPHSGTRVSWAVKESKVLQGQLDLAIARPGLGIALFTTELASRVFGSRANAKIHNCIEWGLGRTDPAPPFFILEQEETFIDGSTRMTSDFRHTIALAILMARYGAHLSYQSDYLRLVLDNASADGGWPAVIGRQVSDLPATAYVVEYLAVYLRRSLPSPSPRIAEAIQRGQEWLVLSALRDGGWATNILSNPWDSLWSTAYILPRLLAAELPTFSEWSQALLEATKSLLRDAHRMKYDSEIEQLRIEARVAAALVVALRILDLDNHFRDRAENWLNGWDSRFLRALSRLPARECDLATSTFAATALLRNWNEAEIGRRVLSELSPDG